ncbi:nuclear transport factor 2 family protein [Thioalkalivibrio sp. XN8]|nr:nuclear transport factor 2 family protein [Thioalkalivibrio sp. XN8]
MLERFLQVYQALDRDHLHLLDEVYAEDVAFTDPLHHVEGLPALHEYFARMYANVTAVRFDFERILAGDGEAMLTWTMHLQHPRLSPAEPLALPGATHLRFDAKVRYHRDYFDAGALLYERLPLLGGVVRAIRRRV